jgi:molecular chaperone DnaK (HSP70)
LLSGVDARFQMTGLKTKKSLLKALKQAAEAKLTSEEIRKQRVSFIMGSLDDESTITRQQVERILAEREGTRISA